MKVLYDESCLLQILKVSYRDILSFGEYREIVTIESGMIDTSHLLVNLNKDALLASQNNGCNFTLHLQ